MKNYSWVLVFLFSLFFLPQISNSQENFRIEATFSAKEKTPNGKSKLTMGKVFFDKNDNKIVYEISFPDKAKLVVTDTVQYIIKEDSITTQTVPSLNQMSIFSLALNGSLDNFGLEKLKYTINSVEKSGDLVITNWFPPEDFQKNYGKIALSQKDRNLYGVIFFTPDETILGKQIFRKYTTVNGVSFPQEVVQITVFEGEEFYKLTSFSDIKVNNLENDATYLFDIDALKELDK